jgi:hypothetical protein
MANRMQTPVSMASFEKLTKVVFAKVTFGATGAPTLSAANSKGVLSVSRTSAGLFVFTFGTSANNSNNKDMYYKLLCVKHVFNTSATSAAPASPAMYISADASATYGTSTMSLTFNSAGTPTDPASGEIVYIEWIFGDSSAP